MNRRRAPFSAVCLLTAAAVLGGCNVTPHAKPAGEALAPTTQSMVLHTGDKLELKFYYAPELNDTQQIRPDGKITLQLLGDIQAAGRTPSDFGQDLQKAYSNQLKYPQVSVIVRESSQSKIYVTGEVERPGQIDLAGDMGVIDAVMSVGGFNMTTAATDSIIVMRQVNGKRVGYRVDLHDALKGGEHTSFALAPQDIVFVPRTSITNVDNFVTQYFNDVVPQTGVIYTSTTGNHTVGINTSNR